jgi:acyl-CoA synthetase (NDP forming)
MVGHDRANTRLNRYQMNIAKLANPRSIAILGASERPSIGRMLLTSLERLGFAGGIYPVNPKYQTVLERRCYPSLKDLPEVPDAVALCVGAEHMLAHLRTLAEIGVGAATIYGAGFAESGGEGRKTQAAITELCREAGIALCGPNCMGVLNPKSGATTYIYEVRDPTGLAGNVGLISHSGSIGNGLMADVRRFGFSLVASTGNEAVVDTASIIEYLIDDPETKVIATFTETIRNPERYVAALDRAADRGKPVVVLKVGRSERSKRAITSHTGGLAGESRVFSELLRAHRAIEVHDMDELTEVLAVCQGRRWPRGKRIAVITASGGHAELILDVATANGIDLPPLSPADRATVEGVFGTVVGDGNPLDSWGNRNWDVNAPHALATFNASSEYDAIVLCQDNADNQPMVSRERLLDEPRLLAKAAAASEKPHYFMNTRPGVMHLAQVKFLAEHGVVQIGGSRQGLAAITRLAEFTAQRRPLRQANPRKTGLREMLAGGGRATIHEADAKRVLQSCGVPVARERLARSKEDARAAATEIGYPLVLKVVSDDIPHKSEHGLILAGVADDAALGAGWDLLAERLAKLGRGKGANFLVQEFVEGGIEVFGGVSRDPDFGLVLAFGMGGVDIELKRDFALRVLPLREGDVEAMIAETKGAGALKAHRGRPEADIAGLAACLYALADFAAAEVDHLEEIDLNPIMVLPSGRGCVVVDALIVPRRSPV